MHLLDEKFSRTYILCVAGYAFLLVNGNDICCRRLMYSE